MGLIDLLLSRYARAKWRGFHRLLRVTGRDRSGSVVVARTDAGTLMALDPSSYIDRHVLQEGYYESEVLAAVIEGMAPGDVLWDIGANIGLHSIALKFRLPDSHVFSFEPSPAILGSLWRNARLNGSDIKIMSLALSDRAGLATLHIADPGNPGMTTLAIHPGFESAYCSEVTVATVDGDSLIRSGQAAAPNVIKIDVEGHEAAVLEGMRDALTSAACKRVIFEDGGGESEVKALLTDFGFTIERLSRNEATSHELHNFAAVKVRPEGTCVRIAPR